MDEKAIYFLAEQIRELAAATTSCVEAHGKALAVTDRLIARQALTEANMALVNSRLNHEQTLAERDRIRRVLEAEIRLTFSGQIAARGGGMCGEALEIAQIAVLAALDRVCQKEG